MDLAIILTLLLDRSDKEEVYSVVKDLYERLLGREIKDGELNLDVLLGADFTKSQKLSGMLAIPPVAVLNSGDMRNLYERTRDVLIDA